MLLYEIGNSWLKTGLLSLFDKWHKYCELYV
jgi:hypothetical protein